MHVCGIAWGKNTCTNSQRSNGSLRSAELFKEYPLCHQKSVKDLLKKVFIAYACCFLTRRQRYSWECTFYSVCTRDILQMHSHWTYPVGNAPKMGLVSKWVPFKLHCISSPTESDVNANHSIFASMLHGKVGGHFSQSFRRPDPKRIQL